MNSPNEDKPAAPQSPEQSAADALRRKHADKLRPGVPQIDRLYRLSPLSPWWTALLFAVASIAILTLIEIISGRMDGILNPVANERERYLFVILHLMLLAYIPTAVVVLGREARRNAHALSHLVEPSDEMRERLARVGTYPLLWYLLWGAFGVTISLLAPLLDADVWRDHLYQPYDFSIYAPEVWAQRLLAVIFGFFAGVLPFAAMAEGRRFNQFARHVTNDHVLERHCLLPFTRQGLSNVLIVAGFPAIFALFLLNTGLIYMVVGVGIFALVAAVGGLLWPLMGIHARIKAAKTHQINWVNKELSSEVNSLRGGAGDRFVTLMAYRSYIEQVREWPLDGSTVSRLMFYLAIPLISWSGAAMVERMIDAALG